MRHVGFYRQVRRGDAFAGIGLAAPYWHDDVGEPGHATRVVRLVSLTAEVERAKGADETARYVTLVVGPLCVNAGFYRIEAEKPDEHAEDLP